jgi:hypothetical protein
MSKPTMALVMCAEGVTSVSSMLDVMMPARCGGVCGNPPAGAAGMVDGIVVVLTKRAAGLVSYAAPNGLLICVDMPNAKPSSKLVARPTPTRSNTFE